MTYKYKITVASAIVLVAVLLLLILSAINNKRPLEISLKYLDKELIVNEPYEGSLELQGKMPLKIKSDKKEIIITENKISWTPAEIGKKIITFTVTDKEKNLKTAIWEVQVITQIKKQTDPLPKKENASSAKIVFDLTSLPQQLTKDEVYQSPVIVSGAENILLLADNENISIHKGVFKWAPEKIGQFEIHFSASKGTEKVSESWKVNVIAPIKTEPTKPVEPPQVEKNVNFKKIEEFKNESFISVNEKNIYYQGDAPGKIPPNGFFKNKLKDKRVNYRFEFSDDLEIAKSELSILTEKFGASVIETEHYLNASTNTNGKKILNGKYLNLPKDIWWAIFKSEFALGAKRNGIVAWDIGQYTLYKDSWALKVYLNR